MFKYLKRRFMLIYSLSILLLIVFSFSLIFYSSYIQTKTDIEIRLKQKGFDKGPFDGKDEKPPLDGDVDGDFIEEDIPENKETQIYSEDIYLTIDSEYNIVQIGSSKDVSDDDLSRIQNTLAEGQKNIIKIDDDYYFIDVKGNNVHLLTITQSLHSLQNLLVTLVVSGIIILILTLIIGNFFASNALKPVKESFEKQERFVSDASHEIKTPISVISSCLELIKDGDDESEKWIDYCITETERLKNLTSNLLTLSKDLPKIDPSSLEYINLSEKIELLLCAYEVNLFEDQFTLKSNIEENIKVKFLDEDFTQLFHILMDNAIKYSDDRKRIIIDLKRTERGVDFTIANTSDFIDEKELSQVFNRFYRKDKSRNKKIEGFGLGLSIAKQTMERYNLKYKVEYKESMFTFSIILPNEIL